MKRPGYVVSTTIANYTLLTIETLFCYKACLEGPKIRQQIEYPKRYQKNRDQIEA